LILDAGTTLQPDILLYLEKGGGTTRTEDGYLAGAPEFVVEIAATSTSLDLDRKLQAYQRHGVREYIVWSTGDAELYWFVLEEGGFEPNHPDEGGTIRSRQFPGLHLAADALLSMRGAEVLATVQRGIQSPEHAQFIASLATR
jgi:Uma2 family endonuclease